ncbi:MAG TPA: endonuclease III [Syntrophorhabdaceae bacterium]|nr:endonuclease III [Syntrophorhabdaceae bacterium]HOT42823.1 endonuclease III [Syntrophorhabdaceae bacterium]HPC66524.1 endonuclease III [Syntrophorhabdaceae bacterium]HPP41219.1 endonuclease III [Syntrophorhabdaceae bacterium]HQE80582.1 endonuclease III [Syntrophorhabdaceae bacterium]
MEKDIDSILKKLREMHGKARIELVYSNPLELTISTILSAQCTDERVNKLTKTLFKKYKTIDDYLNIPVEELEEDIKPTGFYRNKAKAIKNVVREIKERFKGQVPDDIDTFSTVKGIGRKSANLIVGVAFGKPAIIVDTHVIRLSNRIGLTKNKDPEKIEQDLRRDVDEKYYTELSLLLTLHGRYICKAKKPGCENCLLQNDCDYYRGGKDGL